MEQGPNWPGTVIDGLSEENQREFYRYWGELMASPVRKAVTPT